MSHWQIASGKSELQKIHSSSYLPKACLATLNLPEADCANGFLVLSSQFSLDGNAVARRGCVPFVLLLASVAARVQSYAVARKAT